MALEACVKEQVPFIFATYARLYLSYPLSLGKSLAIAAIGCAVRPTNAIIWLTLIILHYVEGTTSITGVLASVLPVGYVGMMHPYRLF